MTEKEIYLIGAGGHAKVIIALINELGLSCRAIYDDAEKLHGTRLCGVPITGPVSALPDREDISAVIAIGVNETRRRISMAFKNVSWRSLVHPHSWVHSSVIIGPGSVVFAGAVIQPDSVIGAHSIVNTSVSIDHDCRVGDFCHLAPGCHMAGGVQIGDNVFCGVGSSIIQYVSVCGGVIIGAGAAVTKHITMPGTYVGLPAKRHA